MVLVTGGAGYIGSHTCVELLKRGYEIVVVDNLSNSHPKAIERMKTISGRDFSFYQLDVCNANDLDTCFSTHPIDCVIHFAGLKAVGESVAVPISYYENNLMSTLVLLKAMIKHKVRNFIFSSSATVYSADNTMPLKEDANLGDCACPYGWTKYMNEQIITDAVAAEKDMSAVLLRYFNPIGAHESGFIGEDPTGIPNNLLPFIAQTAVGKHKEVLIYGNDYDTPDGTGIRDYIHVNDLATGHIAAIDYCKKSRGTNAFNLGSGLGVSVLEMVNTFEQVNGVKIPYRFVTRRPGDLPVGYADPSKAAEILNWRTEKTLEQGLSDTWRWQSNNPDGYNG
jgi:UDP-glucose 4-epimerase